MMCPTFQDGCHTPDRCEAEGECHYTGSPFPSVKSRLMRDTCSALENLRSEGFSAQFEPKVAKMEHAIREALKIIGSTQARPYAALSRIDGILREGLR